MTIDAKEDNKVDNDDDTSVGTMCLSDNTITVTAGDGFASMHQVICLSIAVPILLNTPTEGLSKCSLSIINGGDITIYVIDDGVNAANKYLHQSGNFLTMNGGT